MEVATTATALDAGTGAKTIAAQVPAAVEKHSGRVAQKHKADGRWVDTTYDEMGVASMEVALGLLDLGIRPRDRVAILSHTRPEWTWANFGTISAGATSVSIYQTNSPEECHYVLEHSESRAVFVEDEEQLGKVREVRDRLPALEHVVLLEPGAAADDAIALDALRERGRAAGGRDEWLRAADAVSLDDPCQFIYTSGTTGPPKGCVITHGNYAAMRDMVLGLGSIATNEVVYLYLPLAHSFALLVQFASFDIGNAIAYWEKDPQRIVANLQEVRPHYFPSVPRVFEKIYTLATAEVDPDDLRKAVDVGLRVRLARQRGEEVPAELQTAFDALEGSLYTRVRAIFGGNITRGVSGAAPIAREVLEFFFACGIPILEGYGMTETSTAATGQTVEDFRFGSVGRILPGMEARIAEDGELLLRGPNIFRGYHRNDEATSEALSDGWLHTGDIAHVDEDGFVYITGRKKDIIITAGGKNITPANLENGLKQSRWVSQAVVIGDRRPYLVALITLDPEEVPAFAERHGLAPADVPGSEEMRAELQRTVDEVNSKVGRVEQIKRFEVLREDLSQATGELTPTLKVKRNVVAEKYASEIEGLYAAA
ncbi:MAG TPA: AMP-dependent synthetase/ligase [Thermoleophilaceae bacterium]|jgi:long-chain acyl-CoA synthetase